MEKLIISMVLAVLAAVAQAQPDQEGPSQQKVITDPAEYNAYVTAINLPDPAQRASALESFLQRYPGTVMKSDALEQLLAAYGASPDQQKLEETAARILVDDPNNLRALAVATAIERTQGTPQSIADAAANARKGLQALDAWIQPEGMTDEEFERLGDSMAAIFEGAAGFAALQSKDYVTARAHFLNALENDPDNLLNTYQLAIAELQMTPIDLEGFWYGAKAIRLAADNPATLNSFMPYIKAKYRKYHGRMDDWDEFAAAVAGQTRPPIDMEELVPAAPTPCDVAVQAVKDNDPNQLSISDWEFILSRADCSPGNHDAADKIWRAILKMQKNPDGEAWIKFHAVLVVAATEDTVQAAITEDNQCGKKPDLAITLAVPALDPPAPGTFIDAVGVVNRYQAEPFLFIMEQGAVQAAKGVKLNCPASQGGTL
jgi:tetratricopeptide (TPR) repeat protein